MGDIQGLAELSKSKRPSNIMTDPSLWKIWGVAEANLKDARRYLVESIAEIDSDRYSLTQFDEYLSQNELGLALGEIASIAEELVCKAAFWRRLEAAAEVMGRTQAAAKYREKFLAEVNRH
nr:hypothetical protein [uncultured Rhodoferax sp.]